MLSKLLCTSQCFSATVKEPKSTSVGIRRGLGGDPGVSFGNPADPLLLAQPKGANHDRDAATIFCAGSEDAGFVNLSCLLPLHDRACPQFLLLRNRSDKRQKITAWRSGNLCAHCYLEARPPPDVFGACYFYSESMNMLFDYRNDIDGSLDLDSNHGCDIFW